MAFLRQPEVGELVRALIVSGIDVTGSRNALLQFINPLYVGTLPVGGPPATQLLNDIGRMNQQERLTNGDIPLEIYLRNALLLVMGVPQAESAVQVALNKVVQRASGAPTFEPRVLPEIKEKIVHTDDTVPFAFMEAGVKAAAAVLKLKVPRFEDGQPKLKGGNPIIHLGTGWLLTHELVMTNHHVVNARSDGEPNASVADFTLQAAATKGVFDFDGDALVGIEVTVTRVEAWDAQLDYALLRIPASARAPLARAPAALHKGSEPVPVNIIQHPGGRSKRFAIRNNLVSRSEGTELYYFTDTDGGSSGAPVFNDRWEVVAVHRSAVFVEDVKFQGKPTAYVNAGTHLASILADLRQRHPAIAAEIG